MEPESSKILGGIGAILMFIGPFGASYTGIVGFVGLILVLVALNGLADYYKERRIFNNVLYAAMIAIVGGVVSVVVIVIAAIDMLPILGIHISNWTDWSALQKVDWQNFTNWSALAPYVGAIIGALIILFVCAVVAAILLRRSLITLSEKSGTHLFATAGLLMLIGAVLTIVLVGLILLWVSLLLLAIAFFEMRTQPAPTQTTMPSPPSS
ncbi:MAG: DUF996 domain-containing protein [Candidatus Bathyarchaeia archaeon]|jgi:uncharacterized membrane protein